MAYTSTLANRKCFPPCLILYNTEYNESPKERNKENEMTGNDSCYTKYKCKIQPKKTNSLK